ncbi:peptidylprolyl isomerase [Psychromonas algicola]|uniref:peptidylprolyl isomerase n=1 Tax=Psychromonas algicola TaxID=2555642 RepID=UPI0010682B8A|nr:peptidylprolyl isomerase [Psychromonas sp. RZ5]TEW51711.1 peptidyl-prolyl cis-trans isomerase [Psychromonas sp. RZ5]
MKFITALIFLLVSNIALAIEKPILINPIIEIDTNQGKITVQLFTSRAPNTVANFLNYIDNDEYSKSMFHRVINDFMIQGGGFYESGQQLKTFIAIGNESRNGLSNIRGTIAMARTSHPHSATRQFYINHRDNTFLDAKNTKYGYAVFGKVTLGMDVVDKIAAVETDDQDKPVVPVIINSITVLKAAPVQEIPVI